MKDFSTGTAGAPRTSIVRRWSRHFAIDLVGVAAFVVLAVVVLVVADVSSPVGRAAVGFPLLFLAPGYAIVSAAFPRTEPIQGSAESAGSIVQTTALSDVERAALSFGLSFAVLPILGVAIGLSPYGFSQEVVVGSVAGFALLGVALAGVRRSFVPEPDRYRVDFGARFAAAWAGLFHTGSALHTAVNVALVVSMVLALSSVGYALVAPQDGERYTNVELLTEDGDGDLVASGYPDEFEPGEPRSLVVEVDNREEERTEYELVIVVERVQTGDDGLRVIERQELDRFSFAIEDGETWTNEHELTPEMVGTDLRVSYLLYEDGAPEDPTEENAYRHVYFWTDVQEGAESGDDAEAQSGTSEDEEEQTDEDAEEDDDEGDDEDEDGEDEDGEDEEDDEEEDDDEDDEDEDEDDDGEDDEDDDGEDEEDGGDEDDEGDGDDSDGDDEDGGDEEDGEDDGGDEEDGEDDGGDEDGGGDEDDGDDGDDGDDAE